RWIGNGIVSNGTNCGAATRPQRSMAAPMFSAVAIGTVAPEPVRVLVARGVSDAEQLVAGLAAGAVEVPQIAPHAAGGEDAVAARCAFGVDVAQDLRPVLRVALQILGRVVGQASGVLERH